MRNAVQIYDVGKQYKTLYFFKTSGLTDLSMKLQPRHIQVSYLKILLLLFLLVITHFITLMIQQQLSCC